MQSDLVLSRRFSIADKPWCSATIISPAELPNAQARRRIKEPKIEAQVRGCTERVYRWSKSLLRPSPTSPLPPSPPSVYCIKVRVTSRPQSVPSAGFLLLFFSNKHYQGVMCQLYTFCYSGFSPDIQAFWMKNISDFHREKKNHRKYIGRCYNPVFFHGLHSHQKKKKINKRKKRLVPLRS